MFQRNGVGLDWLTLFHLKANKDDLLANIKSAKMQFSDWNKFDQFLSIKEVLTRDSAYQQACKIAILKFCLEDTTFARDIFSEQDYQKCLSLIHRKQYNSKLLLELLNKFNYFLSYYVPEENDNLETLLKLDILRQTNEIRDSEAEKSFLPLIKQINSIASGVKGFCYLAAENPQNYYNSFIRRFDFSLNDELNKCLKDKYNYDFNHLHHNGRLKLLVLFNHSEEHINQILQYALLNDSAFWSNHKNFSIIHFLELIYSINDSRHAEKVLCYIFDNIEQNELGKKILGNHLPLNFLNRKKFVDGLEERTFRFAFDRFSDEYNLKPLLNCKLCYPFSEVENCKEKLLKGKELANELFRTIYPEDHRSVLKYLNDELANPSPVLPDDKQTLLRDVIDTKHNIQFAIESTEQWSIKNIFESHTFGYHTDILDRKAINILCPDYFNKNNTWNRFYLKCYYMFEITKNKKTCFVNLFEIFYDLYQFIEKKINIRTSFQRNIEGREIAYEQLKTILKHRSVHISDNFKNDYIISLLDRKVAIREESEKFPILEQLGDAVYGIAVAELLFYNPFEDNISQSYNNLITAQSQISVAKKIGIEKLYLSASSLCKKYERDILIDADTEPYVLQQEMVQISNKQKYLADSLEMIIGTLCKDCGYEIAISFSKTILKETFTEQFGKEIHWPENYDLSIDRDYWTRILPSPYSSFDNNQHILWMAFDKFYKAYVLGTEDIATRRYITYSFSDNKLYDVCDFYMVDKVFFEYLHKGLENAINKYSNSVKEKYKELQ